MRILRLFSLALVVLLLPATSFAATPNRDPRPHADLADAIASPLDLRQYAFGQRGTELVLRVTTAGEWETTQLSATEGRALCVRLFYGKLATPRARICAIDAGGGQPGLTYARLDPFGGSVSNSFIDAFVSRPDKRSLEAVFDASSVNLAQGRYSWQMQSEWSCEEPFVCSDFAPDSGNVIARIRPLAEPPCFGAASRNPLYRCTAPALRLAVVPTPEEALLSPNARCEIVSTKLPYTCQFGVRSAVANRTIALVGDSHASHWRGALEVVAHSRRWHGYSLTRSGCPLSTAPPDLPKQRRDSCAEWRRSVFGWFRRHPDVSTVFVSELAGLEVRAPAGWSRRDYAIRGYLQAWRRLPRTVRQVIVLRDTPTAGDHTPDCIERAMRTRRPAGFACALSRAKVLPIDPAAIAARRLRSRRVHVIDLTPFMCSRRLCFPVVGGVLVHKDKTHITNVFAGTLGPFVLKGVDRLLGG